LIFKLANALENQENQLMWATERSEE
jgi:hypothetical protein